MRVPIWTCAIVLGALLWQPADAQMGAHRIAFTRLYAVPYQSSEDVQFSPSGTEVIVSSDNRATRVLESSSGRSLLELPAGTIRHILCCSGGNYVTTVQRSSTSIRIELRDRTTYALRSNFDFATLGIQAISPDGHWLSGEWGVGTRVLILDAANAHYGETVTWVSPNHGAHLLTSSQSAFSPNSSLLAYAHGGFNNAATSQLDLPPEILIGDLSTNQDLVVIPISAHRFNLGDGTWGSQVVNELEFDHAGARLIAAFEDGSVDVYGAAPGSFGRLLARLNGGEASNIGQIWVSADDSRVFHYGVSTLVAWGSSDGRERWRTTDLTSQFGMYYSSRRDVFLWSVQTGIAALSGVDGRRIQVVGAPSGGGFIRMSPSEELALTFANGEATVWRIDWRTG